MTDNIEADNALFLRVQGFRASGDRLDAATVVELQALAERMRIGIEAEKALGVRCRGECCKSFIIWHGSPSNAREGRVRLKLAADRERGLPVPADVPDIGPHEDLIMLDEMLIEVDPTETGVPRYSCKHFQDGNCSVYDTRPKMCRDYPTNGVCEHKDCKSINRIKGPVHWLEFATRELSIEDDCAKKAEVVL